MFNTPEMDAGWHAMISEWSDAIAVVGSNGVFILFAIQHREPIFIPLPDVSEYCNSHSVS